MQLSHFTYRFVPSREPSDKLLVVLHGRGDSLEGFTWLPQALGLPRLNYLFLNAPDDYYGGYSWYGLPPNQAPGVLRSRELLFKTLDELREQGWASENITMFGFSQGCLMAIDVGLRYPHALGGICGVSGYVMFPDRLAETVPQAFTRPWLVTHGTHDEVLPIETTREQVGLLKAHGLPIAWHEFPKPHTIDPERELPLIRDWLAQR